MPLTPAGLLHPVSARYPFTRDGWLFELKHDGFRAFVRIPRALRQLPSAYDQCSFEPHG